MAIPNKEFEDIKNQIKKFVGFGKTLLEVGSGTCQLSNYLAIGTNNEIYAFDASLRSLKMGKEFADAKALIKTRFPHIYLTP